MYITPEHRQTDERSGITKDMLIINTSNLIDPGGGC